MSQCVGEPKAAVDKTTLLNHSLYFKAGDNDAMSGQ